MEETEKETEALTLQQFADASGISYQAVSALVKRHSKELKGHISKQNGARYLDAEAIEILKSYRRSAPVAVYDPRLADNIKKVQADNEILKDKLISVQEAYINLQQENAKLIQNGADNIKLIAQVDELQKVKEEAEQRKETDAKRIAELEAELQAEKTKYKKSVFGLFKKVKGD